jgi:hypothetical protein
MEIPGDDQKATFQRLVKLAIANGIEVWVATPEKFKVWFPDDDFVYGCYEKDDQGTPKIHLNNAQSLNTALMTLLHELGHHLEPARLHRLRPDLRDVWAEAFAQLVAQQLGFDTLNQSVAYLKRFRQELWVIQNFSRELDGLAVKVASGLR